MRKLFRYALACALFLSFSIVNHEAFSGRGNGQKNKYSRQSQKITYKVERQTQKNRGRSESFITSKKRNLSYTAESDEFSWPFFVLMSMLVIHDINSNYYSRIYGPLSLKETSSRLSKNSPRVVGALNNLGQLSQTHNSTEVFVKDPLLSSTNSSIEGIKNETKVIPKNLLSVKEGPISKASLKTKLRLDEQCTKESYLGEKKNNGKVLLEENGKLKQLKYIPDYRKITGAKEAHKNDHKGENVNVLVLDVAVDRKSLLDSERVYLSYDDVSFYKEGKFIENEHSTHICGIIQAMSPLSTIASSLLYEDAFNDFKYANIYANYLSEKGEKLDVVNYSVGLENALNEKLLEELKSLTDKGTVVFIAFGNDGEKLETNTHYKELVEFVNNDTFKGLIRIVGNLRYFGKDDSESMDSSSNRCFPGQDCKYVIFAPGTDICSTLPNTGFGTKTGTSMATPMVVGGYALLKGAFPDKTPHEILALMDESARKKTLDGENLGHEYGVGILDIENAFVLAKEKGWVHHKDWYAKMKNYVKKPLNVVGTIQNYFVDSFKFIFSVLKFR